MMRSTLINRTVHSLTKLPIAKVKEVSDFAEYISKIHEEETLQKGIKKLVSNSESFQFLNEDEDLYSLDDLKEKF